MNTLIIVAATIIVVITAIVSAQAFRECSAFRFPGQLACCVAVLCYIGLTQAGSGLISGIMIPYAALGISIVAVLIVLAVAKAWSRRERTKSGATSLRRPSQSSTRSHGRD